MRYDRDRYRQENPSMMGYVAWFAFGAVAFPIGAYVIFLMNLGWLWKHDPGMTIFWLVFSSLIWWCVGYGIYATVKSFRRR